MRVGCLSLKEGTLEDDEDGTLFTKYTDKYYILNVSKQRTLTNGFRYIKELLFKIIIMICMTPTTP